MGDSGSSAALQRSGAEPGVPPTPVAAAQGPGRVCQPRRARGSRASGGVRGWTARQHRDAVQPRPGGVPRRANPHATSTPDPAMLRTQVGEGAPYVPEEAAVADDTTTPLAHRVRQRIRAEEQLSRAQPRQRAQPVPPVGGAELFHFRRLHPRRTLSPQASAASCSWRLAGCREPRAPAPSAHVRPRGRGGRGGPLSMPRWGPEAGHAGRARGLGGCRCCCWSCSC